jgi:hypothetical protein
MTTQDPPQRQSRGYLRGLSPSATCNNIIITHARLSENFCMKFCSSAVTAVKVVQCENTISAWNKWDQVAGVVSIATGYGLDDRGVGVRVPIRSRIFSTSSRPALGPIQPPIQGVSEALSVGVKRPGREADHSFPTSAEVKNA